MISLKRSFITTLPLQLLLFFMVFFLYFLKIIRRSLKLRISILLLIRRLFLSVHFRCLPLFPVHRVPVQQSSAPYSLDVQELLITLILGMVVAFVVSLFAIKFLVNFVKKHDFKVFGYYRIVLGIIVIVYFLAKTFAF